MSGVVLAESAFPCLQYRLIDVVVPVLVQVPKLVLSTLWVMVRVLVTVLIKTVGFWW